MKKLIVSLMLALLAPVAWAQTASTYYTVPTIAALKALTTRPSVIQTTDANPGIFNWSTTPCSAADDIFQVTPTSGPTGCYVRAGTPYAAGKSATTNGVLVTNGTGVPSISTTLPSGLIFSGPLSLANGTAATPSLAFSSDTSTGLYRIGSGKIGISLSGTRFVAFDASGNAILGAGAQPAGGSLTTGSNDTLISSRSGANVTDWNGLVLIGVDTGLAMTTSAGRTGTNPSACVGYTTCKTTLEGSNAALGAQAVGGNSLTSGTSVYSETGIGNLALAMANATQKDTAVGDSSLAVYQRGGQMVGLGRSTFQWLTEGGYGIALGHAAGFYSVWDSQGIYIGNQAGSVIPSTNPPRITADVTAGVMTVTVKNGADGNLAVGQTCVSTTATGFVSNYVIASLGTGTGGTGTYNVTPNNQNAASQTMQCGAALTNVIVIGNASNPGGFSDQGVMLLGNGVTPPSGNNFTVIGHGQTSAVISGRMAWGMTNNSVTGATQTYTGAQMVSGEITRSGAGTTTDTTATAAQIVAAMPGVEVGSALWLTIANNNTGALSLTAGSGVTASGNTTIASSGRVRFMIRFTNVSAGTEAVTFESDAPTNAILPGIFSIESAGSGVNFSALNEGLLRLTGFTATSTGIVMDFSTADTLHLKNRANLADAAFLAGNATFSGASVIMSALASDATHTDNTVCVDSSNGTLYKGSGTLGVCLGTSSMRYKTDIRAEPFGLPEIMALKPVSYRYLPGFGDSGARRQLGFTAEQMHDVMPALVDLDHLGRPNSIDWPALIPVIVKAIQQQQARIIALEAR